MEDILEGGEDTGAQNDSEKQIILGQKLKYCIIGTIVVLVLGLIVFLYWVFFKLITLIIPISIGYVLIIYSIYLLLRTVVQFLVFPGSFTIWRRGMEQNFGKDIASKSSRRITKLLELVECLNSNNNVDSYKQNQQTLNNDRYTQNYFNNNEYQIDIDDILEIRTFLYSINLGYTGMKQNGKLSKKQQIFDNHFTTLLNLLQNTTLILQQDTDISTLENFEDPLTLNFYELLINKCENLYNLLGINVKIDQQQATVLKKESKIILSIFHDILEEKSLIQQFKQLMFNDTLGTIDQLRVEMQNNFASDRFFLNGYDGKKIDCMYIPAQDEYKPKNVLQRIKNSNRNINYRILNDILSKNNFSENDETGPTLIYCNPNAGFYEFLFYDSEWIEFYLRLGINIVVWNYRGYGRSEGYPSPKKILKDSEILVDHLRDKYNVKNLGVHGQSLGGMFATYLARKKNLNFLLADRTFGMLSDVAYYGLGKIFKILFKLIVCDWDVRSGANFYESQCFKVVAYDPKDQIIPYLASVKNSNSKYNISKNIQRIHKNSPDDIEEDDFQYATSVVQNPVYIAGRCCSRFYKSITSYCRDTFKQDTILREGARQMLCDKEIVSTFFSLQRIMDIIKEVATKKEKQNHQQYKSIYKGTPPTKIRIQLQNISIVNSVEDQPNDPQLKKVTSIDEEVKSQASQMTRATTGYNSNCPSETAIKFDQQSPCHKSNSLNESKEVIIPNTTDRLGSDENLIGDNSYKESIKKQMSKSIVENVCDDLKTSQHFQDFILNLFQLFDHVDAGGLSLSDIFTYYESDRLLIFQQFLINLQVIGSWTPWNLIQNNLTDLKKPRKISISKLSNFIKQLKKILDEQRLNENSKEDQVKCMILEDLETIYTNIIIIHQKLEKQEQVHKLFSQMPQYSNSGPNSNQNSQRGSNALNDSETKMQSSSITSNNGKKSENTSNQNSQNVSKPNIELSDLKKVLKDEENGSTAETQQQQQQNLRASQNSDNSSFPIQINNSNNYLQKIFSGHVILLGCGHNGIYSRKEIFIYEQLLKASGFVPDFDAILSQDQTLTDAIYQIQQQQL